MPFASKAFPLHSVRTIEYSKLWNGSFLTALSFALFILHIVTAELDRKEYCRLDAWNLLISKLLFKKLAKNLLPGNGKSDEIDLAIELNVIITGDVVHLTYMIDMK